MLVIIVKLSQQLPKLKYSDHSVDLFIVIMSTAEKQEHRIAIRESWLKYNSSKSMHKFVIGIKYLTKTTVNHLLRENTEFGDLMLLDVQDSYQLLTTKVAMAMTHSYANFKFKYLLKVDMDSFVQVDYLMHEISKMPVDLKIYWGFFNGHAPVLRVGKWGDHRWNLCDRYLPYALGGGYILGWSVVKFIAENANFLRMFANEDVSVGAWLAAIDVTHFHDVRFNTESISRGCNERYIIFHRVSWEDMLSIQWRKQLLGKICHAEYKAMLSYDYEWDSLPLDCCHRRNYTIL